MGRKSDNQPRNEKGQWVSYASITAKGSAAYVGQSSMQGKEPILVESDSDDSSEDLGVQKHHICTAYKKIKVSKAGGNGSNASQKFSRFFPAELYPDNTDEDMEVSSDGSDDIDELLDEVDEVFAEGEKMMCKDLDNNPAKTKKTIKNGLEWMYQELAGVSVTLRTIRRKQADKKK